MKTPGGRSTGRVVYDWPGSSSLEHAEHNGADKGEGDIRGYNAQSADESHGNAPLVHVVPAITQHASKAFPAQKVSVTVGPSFPTTGRLRQRGKKIVKSTR